MTGNKVEFKTMNRIAVAQKLVKLARELVSVEFPTQDAMDKYLKEHPGADKSLHRVVKTEKAPEDMTPDEVEEVLKKKMGPAYKPQEQRIKEQTEKWNKRYPAKIAVAKNLVKLAKELTAHSKPKIGDIIDTTDQRNAKGDLYMPSYRFGYKLFVSWNERDISSGSDRSRQEAEERLADWVETKDDRWGYVFSRPSGKVLLVLSGKDA